MVGSIVWRENHIVGFELYGMKYRFTNKPVKWQEHERIHEILAGDVQKRRLRLLLENGIVTQRNLEILAIECMSAYFGHLDCDVKPIGNKFNVISSEKGSIAIVSDTGGMYNVIVRAASDSFLFTRLMEQYPENHGMVEVGSRTFAMYEKFGYDLASVQGDMAEVVRFNYKDENKTRDIKDFAEQFGLTVWEVEYDSAVSVHPSA